MEQPKHEQISELRVMKSAAGFYLGREQYDADFDGWGPYSRVSGYMREQEQAEQLLEKANAFKDMLKELKPDFLEAMRDKLNMFDDDPQVSLKLNLIDDELKHDRGMDTLEITDFYIER